MRTRLLSGSDGSAGAEVDLTVTTLAGLNDGTEAAAAEGSRAFRAAPLLRLVGAPGHRTLVVGQLRVEVGTSVAVEAAVQAAWREEGGWTPVAPGEVAVELLVPALQQPGHEVPAPGRTVAGQQRTAAVVAKALAEGSRNAVADLRAVRYGLEERLAEDLRGKKRRTGLLSQIVEVALAVNRARDQAREAAREGLWLWLTDDEAYQQHRRALDPSVITSVGPADDRTRAWMRTHDAAVRQCAGMEALLGEEARLLYDLLGGASTVEASREADAQETLNQLLTAAGVGLGLPALLLTLYGVDGLTPVRGVRGVLAVVFIAAVTLLAATLPSVLVSRSRRVSRRIALVAAGVGLVALLVLAGLFAP